MRKRSTLIYWNTQSLLIIIGLILIISGNQIHFYLFKLEIGEFLVHIGALILFIGTLHFLFDYNLRKEFQEEIATSILGNTNVHRNGIVDTLINSKEIKEAYFLTSEKFIISVSYGLRFLETHLNTLESRSERKKQSIIVHYASNSLTTEYLNKIKSADINNTLAHLNKIINNNSKIQNGMVKLIPIESILKYNFIYTDNFIWIKLYGNSQGLQSELPAIKVDCETPLYKFFENDIQSLIKKQ